MIWFWPLRKMDAWCVALMALLAQPSHGSSMASPSIVSVCRERNETKMEVMKWISFLLLIASFYIATKCGGVGRNVGSTQRDDIKQRCVPVQCF